MRDGLSSMGHYDQGTLSPQKVDEKLYKGVDGEGFVDVAERIEVEGSFERDDGCP